MIAICVPSRGLVYARTVESIMKGMKHLNSLGLATNYYTTYDMPIPGSHSFCVEQALQDKAQRIIFVEEDMYIFPEGFEALASSEYDIATMQYNDKNGSPHGIIHYDEQGNVLWAGLGATSIKSEVFKKIGNPYFRTDIIYKVTKKRLEKGKLITQYEELPKRQTWNEDESRFEDINDEAKYGMHDVDLYTRARKKGFKVGVLEGHKAHHFDLVKLGEPHTNHGCHIIRQV